MLRPRLLTRISPPPTTPSLLVPKCKDRAFKIRRQRFGITISVIRRHSRERIRDRYRLLAPPTSCRSPRIRAQAPSCQMTDDSTSGESLMNPSIGLESTFLERGEKEESEAGDNDGEREIIEGRGNQSKDLQKTSYSRHSYHDVLHAFLRAAFHLTNTQLSGSTPMRARSGPTSQQSPEAKGGTAKRRRLAQAFLDGAV